MLKSFGASKPFPAVMSARALGVRWGFPIVTLRGVRGPDVRAKMSPEKIPIYTVRLYWPIRRLGICRGLRGVDASDSVDAAVVLFFRKLAEGGARVGRVRCGRRVLGPGRS